MTEPVLPDSSVDELYRRELRPILHRFARDGRARLSKLGRRAAFLGVFAIALAIALAGVFPHSFIPLLPPIAALAYLVFGYTRAHAGYRAEFKHVVIRPIIAHLNPDLEYSPEGSITRAEFVASRLFTGDIDRFTGEDLVQGSVGRTRIRFSELHVQDRREHGTGKDRRTEWVTLFRGLFVIADFPKRFQGRTLVLPDTAQRLFGGIGQTLQSLNFTRGQLIKLEDPEFERVFVVYGDDQVEARYLLSTSLMQRILDFQRKADADVHLSFADSSLHIALSSARDRLEPPALIQLLSYGRSPETEQAVLRRIAEYVADLQLAIGIVNDLNLNRDIWG